MVEEYPKNLTELEAAFATEETCRAYLARLRWPDGFRCPRCGGGKSWPVRGVLLECAACGCQTSVTRRNDFPGHTDTIACLVPRHVVGDDPEERCQRVGVATSARLEEL